MVTISIAFAVGIAVFGLIWLYVRNVIISAWGQAAAMTFTPARCQPALDPNGHLVYVRTGDFVPFEPRHERYMKIAEVVTTLSSASLIFVPNSRLNVYPHSCAFAIVLLGFSVFYSIGFMAALTYFYEGALYQPASYTPTKYGMVHAFGFGGLICFALAYILLAVRVGWALIYSIGGTSRSFFP